MMHIQPYLLENKNTLCLKSQTIASLLNQRDITHLWSQRTSTIDTIIIHAISAIETAPGAPYDADEIISIFIEYEVSAHYLILRDGTCLNLVPENQKAWHAGPSIMPPPDHRQGVNDFSLGIELVGENDVAFTSLQYRALTALIEDIKQRHHISAILGHSDIAGADAVDKGLRSTPKWDPGTMFEWSKITALKPISLKTTAH